VVGRDKKADNVWTAVAPGGAAVAWKDDGFTVVRALPGGEPVARVKSGFGYDLRFSPGGRWLTEHGERVFRVFDRHNGYRVFARIRMPSFMLADVTDGLTAVVNAAKSTVAVWDLSGKSPKATLPVGGSESALAVSADGRRVLTANLEGEVTLWDATGTRLQRYDWGLETPIAVAFARDGTRAAAGGTDGRIVVWDLDE
jgi:DNA-binding beta-propeller fold protein YncE